MTEQVLNKFNEYLLELIKDEEIKLRIFDKIEDLPANKNEKVATTIGMCSFEGITYSYPSYYSDKTLNNLFSLEKALANKTAINPEIHLTKDYNVFTLAHELGHYFMYKNFEDASEDSANRYISTLAKSCLNDDELYEIKTDLKIESGVDIDKKKDNKKKRFNWLKSILS